MIRFRKRQSYVETLESRRLLAGDLVAHWRAQELLAVQDQGTVIAEWADAVGGTIAKGSGDPILQNGVIGGRAVVNFDRSGQQDSFLVSKADNPLAGISDFTVAFVFSTSSQTLMGDKDHWYNGTGLVHSNQIGFAKDWGVAIHTDGTLSAGVGGGFGKPSTSVFATAAGFNDGEAHTVVFSKTESTIALYVDEMDPVSTANANAAARDSLNLEFGIQKGHLGEFEGNLAEVRIYDGGLSAIEVATVQEEITQFYNNQRPIGVPDSYTVAEDSFPLFISASDGVLKNDSDPDGDPITAQLISSTTNGELSFLDDGAFVYDPHRDYFGPDSFTYQPVDFLAGETVTVSIEVTPQYDPAIGVPEWYKLQPKDVLEIDLVSGVLSNDKNVDELPLSVQVDRDVEFGQLNLAADGSFRFDPLGTAGTTSFTYRINDTVSMSAPTEVTLVVNTPPVAVGDSFLAVEDVLFNLSGLEGVLANDRDAENDHLTVTLIQPTEQGTLLLAEDGTILYEPEENFFGLQSFVYQLHDGIDDSEIVRVDLQVQAVNDDPVAANDVFFVTGDGVLEIDVEGGVLKNDTDVDDVELSVRMASEPAHGTITLNADGSFRFVAESPEFQGKDRFTYEVFDDEGAAAIGTVELFIGESPLRVSEFMSANAATLLTRTRPRRGFVISR